MIGRYLAVIRSPPQSREALKLALMRNEIIKMFDDISLHHKLEAECCGTNRNTVLVASYKGVTRHGSIRELTISTQLGWVGPMFFVLSCWLGFEL